MTQRESHSIHIYESLALLEEQEKESLTVAKSSLFKDHIISIKLGLRFLEIFLAVSSNEDLKLRVRNVVYSVREELHTLSNTPVDGSLTLDSAYANVREKMKNVIIKQETQEYIIIFQQIFNWVGSFKKTNDFLLECFGVLSSYKADLIALLLKEVKDLKDKLLHVQALLTYVADAGVHVKEKNKKLLTPLASFLEKAACLLYSCSMEKMHEEMALVTKHELSDFLEKVKVKEIYVAVLKASELLGSTENPLESEIYLLDVLINLLNSIASSGIYLNDLSKKIYDKLKILKSFLADLPHEQRVENFNYLVATIESITWKSIPLVYSCYNEEMKEDIAGKVNSALYDVLDQIDHIPAEVRDMKLYSYPKTDELGFLDLFISHLEELVNCRSELIEFLRKEIEILSMEFDFLRWFLRISKPHMPGNGFIEDFCSRTISLAYQAEHVIDFYLAKYASGTRIMLSLSEIIEQTRVIKSEVRETYDEEKINQARSIAKTSVHVSSETIGLETTKVIGFKDEAGKIMDYLLRNPKQLDVVSIVGSPGLGKTTLLKKIYEAPAIVDCFDVQVWCSISRTYRKREMVLTILGSVIEVTEAINKLNDEELAKELSESLKGRKYLIVIDDLWDVKAWDDLKRSLPDGKVNSCILISSTFQHVASEIKAGSEVHALCRLSDDESWELFQDKLFQKGNFSKDFLEVGEQIVNNCMGLPLAIVVVVGLLANVEKSVQEWKRIALHLSHHILRDSENYIKVIFDLSYNNLPDNLKSCFLYLGVFAEDEEISVHKLKWLWISEGFIRETETKSLEDVAHEYLMDLICRSLVIATKERSCGGVKACRIHDLLRDFCLEKAKEQSFLQVICVDHWSKFAKVYNQRRLSIHSKAGDLMKAKPSGYSVRSLLYTAAKEHCFYLDISFISQNFMLLSVLDLGCINIGRSFNKIGSLIHLRYLAVNSNVSSIPSSISNLWNLQSLLVYASSGKVVQVPDSIWDMVNLRHVDINPRASFDVHPSRLEKSHLLDNLESLSTPCFSSKEDAENLLRRLPKLQKLKCVFNFHYQYHFQCCQFPKLGFLTQLISLKVTFEESPHPQMRCDFNFPSNLQKLTLCGFPLSWNEVSKKIGKTIPNLKVLKLIEVKYRGWIVDGGDFPTLKYLKLSSVCFDHWIALEGSFRNLEKLVFFKCSGTLEIPSCFEYIPTLRMIAVKNCGRSVTDSAQKIKMEHEELKVYIYPKQHDKMGRSPAGDCQTDLKKGPWTPARDDQTDLKKGPWTPARDDQTDLKKGPWTPARDDHTDLKKGPWTPEEDKNLVNFIKKDDKGALSTKKKKKKIDKGALAPKLKLSLPPTDEVSRAKYLTASEMFKDGDLLVNKDGHRIVFQIEHDAPPLTKPTDDRISLADFDAVKVIGQGKCGIVRLVLHKWTGQFFALKVIQMNIEESAQKNIAQELKINQSAQSPYIVMCYQSFYDNGAISTILEYMDGGSVADFLKRVNRIPEPYLAAICKQVLKGLWYLHHEKHIIHRDLKSSNLLINHRGEVKITDFGVSAILASTSGRANTFVGTYNYMSPERITGGNYGHSSDIWSFGLVMLECATGQFPYSPPQPDQGWDNVYELMEAIVGQPSPSAPSDLFSPQFCSFISACVKKDPKDRPSADELMKHPFITMYDDLDIDLASYFTEAGSPIVTL